MDYLFKRKLIHLLYPNRCPVCGDVIGANDRFCADCEGKLNEFSGSFTVRGADSALAVYEYDSVIKPAVILLKNGTCGNAAFALGTALADKIKACGITCDIIVPVPMHRKAMRKRGYNQAELICMEVGRVLNIPVSKCVSKTISTADQKTLGYEERRRNLTGAFAVTKNVRGRKVLLIDDVCTTGSTFAEITSVLLNAGASSVTCAACCKTVRSNDNDVQ
ncbi:MAG: ComF family protein [Ruminococcus sp.]|nr:ComF family protein [Ruminococcus sp.]